MNKPRITVLLEDIRSVFNVGSVFRTADAAGIDKLILTGLTAHPPHPRLEKTALGATNSVAWEYHETIQPILDRLRNEGYKLVACELDKQAINLFEANFEQSICLIFGNEVNGVSQQTLDHVDEIIQIPMLGQKQSLNIATSAGVIMYEYRRKLSYS